jgi:hypothetical protein
MSPLKTRRLLHTVRTERSVRPIANLSKVNLVSRWRATHPASNPKLATRCSPFLLSQAGEGRLSTETVDNFVDNSVLCVGDAVQSRLSAKCPIIGRRFSFNSGHFYGSVAESAIFEQRNDLTIVVKYFPSS